MLTAVELYARVTTHAVEQGHQYETKTVFLIEFEDDVLERSEN